jgi:AcrR family transcriptional regulator
MKETVLHHALELFAEKGFSGASMRELARRCGTTASNVYNYVPSKEALLRELFWMGARQIRDTLDAGRRNGEPDLARYLAAVIRTVDGNRPLWRLIHRLRLDREVAAILDPDFRIILEEALEELEAYGPDPWLLLSLVDGITAARLQDVPMPPPDEVVATVTRCLEALHEPR